MSTFTQKFPRRKGDVIEHVNWSVDLDTASELLGDRDRLEREVDAMATHLPRWVLTVANPHNDAATCKCGGLLVFDRGMRCVGCGKKRRVKHGRLAWFGLLPPIGVDSLARVKRGLERKGAPAQHVFGRREDIGSFLLVPLLAVYPDGFPSRALRVAYLPGFWQLPHMPPCQASHETHLLGDGLMCLFAGGEWRVEMSCREVLQQRAYAHVIKMLNFANGKRNAFAIVS